MHLTDEDVREFYAACKADGFTLTLEEARFYALRLMRLFEILGRPLPHEPVQLASARHGDTIETPVVEKKDLLSTQ